MSTYKFYYFNFRGRGEVVRLIFAAAGQPYENIQFSFEEWPNLKSQMPLGQVPVLEVDGVKIPQSVTIARFLGKQFNLAGKDNLEQAKVDAVGDTIHDLVNLLVSVRGEKDPTKQADVKKKFCTEDLPKYFQNLEVLGKLYGDGGPYFVGKSLSWADLFFYDVADFMLPLDADCLEKFSWLKQNRAEVEKQPRVAEYLQNRPKTPY